MNSKTCHSVDIVVPVHNQEQLVAETITSVQNQTYPHWRLIAVDDASSDQSQKVVNEFGRRDERICLISVGESSKGACHARNLGFQYGKSPFVMYLDSDDLLSETCLEKRVACLQEQEVLDFVLGNTLLFNVQPYDMDVLWNLASINPNLDLLRFLRQDMPWNTMSPLWRRKSFVRLGGWNEALAASQDWELHIRACYMNMRYKLADSKPDTFYRRPVRERVSIAASHMTTQNIFARGQAIQSIAKLEGFLKSAVRREHVEAYCLRNALQILETERNDDASRFLKACIKSRLFRPFHALAATAILLRGPYWRGSRPMRMLKSKFWSDECRADPWQKVQCAA